MKVFPWTIGKGGDFNEEFSLRREEWFGSPNC
jgi:hypothetical protein